MRSWPPHHVAPRDWSGICVIVASGPSTERVDLSLLRGKHVIAVAHGYRVVPDAAVLVIGGRAFYYSNRLADFRGELIIAAQEYPSWSFLREHDARLTYMVRGAPTGLSQDPGELSGSESSVMLAINYAVHRGVSQIVLLGCDGQPAGDGRRRVGSSRRDTGNARYRYQVQERAMQTQLEPLAVRGVSIVNCSPGTALTIYPRARLEDVMIC